jgi:hypothetical protein
MADMKSTHGKKPKLVLYPARRDIPATRGESRDDFEIYASYRIGAGGGYIGTLKVVRQTDSRLLFPFEGAESIGPFLTKEEAIRAAQETGEKIVQADLLTPEG